MRVLQTILGNWELVSLLLVCTAITIRLAYQQWFTNEDPAYAALAVYILLSITGFGTVAYLRARVEQQGSVGKFIEEVAIHADNGYARDRLRELEKRLTTFSNRRTETEGTFETIREIRRAYRSVLSPGEVVVVNPAPVYTSAGRQLRSAEVAALERGVRIVRVGLRFKGTVEDVPIEFRQLGNRFGSVQNLVVGYERAASIASEGQYSGATLYRFGNDVVARIDVLTKGSGTSLQGEFLWGGAESDRVKRQVSDIRGGASEVHGS